jgi:hypothetical protein
MEQRVKDLEKGYKIESQKGAFKTKFKVYFLKKMLN